MNTLLLSASLNTIIDLVALAIICAFIIIGACKGFVKTFFTVFGGFLSLLFAALLCTAVAKTLENHFGLVTSVAKSFSGGLTRIFGETLMNTPLSAATDGTLTEAGVAGWIINLVSRIQGISDLPPETTLSDVICPIFAYYAVAIVGAIVLYILFRLIFFMIGEIVRKLHTFTAIRVTDNVLGALLGIIRGVIAVQAILMLIKIIPISFCQELITAIPSTFLVKLLDGGNLFELIINAFLSTNITDIILGLVQQ